MRAQARDHAQELSQLRSAPIPAPQSFAPTDIRHPTLHVTKTPVVGSSAVVTGVPGGTPFQSIEEWWEGTEQPKGVIIDNRRSAPTPKHAPVHFSLCGNTGPGLGAVGSDRRRCSRLRLRRSCRRRCRNTCLRLRLRCLRARRHIVHSRRRSRRSSNSSTCSRRISSSICSRSSSSISSSTSTSRSSRSSSRSSTTVP